MSYMQRRLYDTSFRNYIIPVSTHTNKKNRETQLGLRVSRYIWKDHILYITLSYTFPRTRTIIIYNTKQNTDKHLGEVITPVYPVRHIHVLLFISMWYMYCLHVLQEDVRGYHTGNSTINKTLYCTSTGMRSIQVHVLTLYVVCNSVTIGYHYNSWELSCLCLLICSK